MTDHEGSEADAAEEINVDDSDSRSCSRSPQNHHNHQPRSESSGSPTPGRTRPDWVEAVGPQGPEGGQSRSHPFSISRLLGSDGAAENGRQTGAGWEYGGARQDGEKSPESGCEDDAASGRTSLQSTNDLLAPFRLFPGAASLLYTGGGVIRVPAHRPPGSQGLVAPWGLTGPLGAGTQQQQAAAAQAGLQTARFLANLAANPLQAHPHLKDRLASKLNSFFSIVMDKKSLISVWITIKFYGRI